MEAARAQRRLRREVLLPLIGGAPHPLRGAAAAAEAPEAADGPLTAQQVAHFRTFGYLVLRAALTPEEVSTTGAEFAAGLALKDHGDRIAGAREQLNWSNLTDQAPTIQSLLEEPRFYGVAQQLLGEDAVGWDSNSNLYSGNRSPCPRPSPPYLPPRPTPAHEPPTPHPPTPPRPTPPRA